ncbi:MAG: substrate-binding domain-containing protein [Epulopiscium sp.]|nr:substrate-binding domain-containing protein [Candidatus Epulonipiscium sp.]
MKFKKLLSVLLMTGMVMGVTACGSQNKTTTETADTTQTTETAETTESTSGDLPLIGVTIYKYDDNFMSYTRMAIEDAAKGKAELLMNDSQNDQSKQNDQVDTMIAKGVKALAINLVDPGAATAIAEKAKAAGLPVIFFNNRDFASNFQ